MCQSLPHFGVVCGYSYFVQSDADDDYSYSNPPSQGKYVPCSPD